MISLGKVVGFDEEIAENVLEYSKGGKRTFLALILLYEQDDFGNIQYHQDHIFPAARLTSENLIEQGIDLKKPVSSRTGLTSSPTYIDDCVFDDEQALVYPSPVNRERLLSFHLLPTLSETSLVNLSLASGVLSDALELDEMGSLMPPATGRSTFTFDVRPQSVIDDTYEHRTGQVEIDTLFAEKRNGETVLFVIEAKTGQARSTLAKHKLVYPILALADSVPSDIDIVPLYIRCTRGMIS
jgi:hypothetical protein